MKHWLKENTVILIRYPFTDGSKSKVRPALIIRDQVDEDIICIPISSSFGIGTSDIMLKENSTVGFVFPIVSYARIQKICTIHSSLIQKKLGYLKPEIYKDIKSKIIQFIS